MSDEELRVEVGRIPADVRARLDAAGFDEERLVALAKPLQTRERGIITTDRGERNRVRGPVEPPRPEDIAAIPLPEAPDHEAIRAEGLAAIRRGEVAFCVMAGGMATRMGGVVKALVEAIDGRTFLDLRLTENATWSRRAGAPVPLWLMTSEATYGPIRQELARRGAGSHVATFLQGVGLRLTPDGHLFVDEAGRPSTYATGHGDLPDALRRSGLLSVFAENGGKYVWIANLDNLGATIDPLLLGMFIRRRAPLLVEVTPKAAGDRGGVPVWVETPGEGGTSARRLQVLEEFRLPSGFDPTAVQVFNTNTFLARTEALVARVPWAWCEVEKTVDGRLAVQFERLLQDLTAAVPAAYVRVPREGVASRFLPVKDHEELARRRGDIRAVALARGML
jgi:UTP--glucose-1-phosphate uridylyltransferase